METKDMDVRNVLEGRLSLGSPAELNPAKILSQQSKLKFEREPAALVQFSPRDLSKSVEITAEQILSRINQALGPDYAVKSAELSKYTPEATAQRIYDGVTALFSAFQRQNASLENDELIDSFMSTIRGGIQKGYSDALGILEAVGAFAVEGVKEGVEQTRILLESKLSNFEQQMKNPGEEKS